MNRQEIYDTLTDIFRKELRDPHLVLSPDMVVKDVDGWESLTHMDIMNDAEKAFGIHISMSDFSARKTLGEIAETLEAKLPDGPKGAAPGLKGGHEEGPKEAPKKKFGFFRH